MSLNYFTFVQRFADLSGTLKSDVNPTLLVPAAIDYAENRILRELNLIAAQVTDNTVSCSTSTRTVSLSTSVGTFITVQEVNVITPSSLTITTGGTRNKLAPAALNWVNFLYPAEVASSVSDLPTLFALKDDTSIVVGTAPGSPYHLEIIGVVRPSQLTTSNSSTFISKVYPDLLVAASMVYTCGYIKDKGLATPVSGDITAAGAYWEGEYQKLYKSALAEDVRTKYNQTLTAMAQPMPTTGGPV